jgi:hypothetical protein
MANWLDTITAPIKTARDTVSQLVEVRDSIKFAEIKTRLLAEISAAYVAATAVKEREAALSEENERLKRDIAELKARRCKLENYELKRLPPGVVVYLPKHGTEESKQPHYACATCYQRGEIQPLQSRGTHCGLEKLHCQGCGSELKTGHFEPPKPVQTRTRYNPFGQNRRV